MVCSLTIPHSPASLTSLCRPHYPQRSRLSVLLTLGFLLTVPSSRMPFPQIPTRPAHSPASAHTSPRTCLQSAGPTLSLYPILFSSVNLYHHLTQVVVSFFVDVCPPPECKLHQSKDSTPWCPAVMGTQTYLLSNFNKYLPLKCLP